MKKGLFFTTILLFVFAVTALSQTQNFSEPVGIGIASGVTPEARLHVYDAVQLGTAAGSYKKIATFQSSCYSNTLKNTLWICRDAYGADWNTVRLHDGIGIDASFTVPGSTSLTWWERDPKDNIQSWGNANITYMTLKGGNLGIGTTTPTQRLEVNGAIRAKKVIIEPEAGADFVFAPEYELPDLKTVEKHIKTRRHLPEIAPAAEMVENGVDVMELNIKLLQKVEELTLYVIQLNKEIEQLKNNK